MKNLKYMLLFAALVLATASCDNRNIRQVVKELSEAPVDTAGMTAVTIKTNDFTCHLKSRYLITSIFRGNTRLEKSSTNGVERSEHLPIAKQ